MCTDRKGPGHCGVLEGCSSGTCHNSGGMGLSDSMGAFVCKPVI